MTFRTRIYACVAGVVGLLAVLIGSTSYSQTSGPGEDNYIRGRALADQFECGRAIKEFERAINANPNDARYHLGRANCRIKQMANSSAFESDREVASLLNAVIDADLAAAIKADPNYAPAYFERAMAKQRLVYLAKADPVLALRDFDRAVELEPANNKFLRERAHYFLKDLKDEKRGLEDMELLIKREPKSPGHLFFRGRYFREAGRFSEAIRDLSAALRLDPTDTYIRVQRARAYFQSDNYPAALVDLNFLAKRLETEVSVYDGIWVLESRAIIYRKQGKTALAIADERRVKRLRDENFDLDKLLNDLK